MALPSNKSSLTHIPDRLANLVLLLCWSAILSEGYDVGVMGTIIPVLSVDPVWHLNPIQIGAMSSAALVGTVIGAAIISLMSDVVGRKRPLIGCVALFSLSMLAAAWAPSPELFSIARFIGGVGLGGLIPVAAALTVEYSPLEKRNLNFALMYSGYPLGALLSAFAGILLMKDGNWRPVVAIGGIPLLFTPLMIAMLPESLDFLLARNLKDKASALLKRHGLSWESVDHSAKASDAPRQSMISGLIEIFSSKMIAATILHGIAQFTAMIVIYGLGSWLPQLMRRSGYDLGSSLTFMIVFDLSSAIGGVLIGRIADHFGTRRTISLSFIVGAFGIAALPFSHVTLINYFFVALAGFGSIGVALVMLGYISGWYGPRARGAASGYAVLVGRAGAMFGPMLGGVLASMSLPPLWNFVAFGCVASVTALVVGVTPRSQAAA
ncbi:MFS transporter [Paraburkholderia sp. ZP32-5]|uniref:MFS transporter n=1 Tax=Paraburkholderia sp. ZP32-5 TaxID=2883245 RepID=UPI001F295CD5|nr:MFS transporter [Paraburkholderia sp. ZP32-5]